jgi:hypothetical protein
MLTESGSRYLLSSCEHEARALVTKRDDLLLALALDEVISLA